MRSLVARRCLLLFALLLTGCAQASVVAPTPVTITIAGSTEMRPVLNALTAAYSERHPNILFAIRGGGSILGETWLANRRIDLAASTRLPEEDDTPATLMRIPIGLDGVSIVVHPDNPVADLTLAQLRDIYSGKILDWQDVGGEPGDVVLVSREDGSATRMLFEKRVMNGEGVTLTAVVMPTSEAVVGYVADHPNAIGYVSRAYVLAEEAGAEGAGPTSAAGRESAAGVRLVAVESRLPTSEEIRTQSYHLTRPIFLLRQQADAPRLQPFLDFVLSPVGQEIVARYHVPIR
jgi:phosphate transport system substrate-binding protein